MPPGPEERARNQTDEAVRQTNDDVPAGAGPTEAAGPQCRPLTPSEAARLLASAAGGERLSDDDRYSLTAFLEAVSNGTFTRVVRILERHGVLQEALEQLYGTESERGRGENQREVPVMCYRFWNATNQIDTDVRRANTIYNPHGIFVRKTADRTITRAETRRVVGHDVDDDFELDRTYERNDDGEKRYTHADMVAVLRRYVPRTVIGGLWARRVINQDGDDLAGTSSRVGSFGSDYHRLAAVATAHSGADTFAHELGHVLIDSGHFSGDLDNLMTSGGSRHKDNVDPDRLTDDQVARIKANALTWARRSG